MIYIKHGQGNAAGGGVKKTWREREGCAFQWEKIQFQIARSLSLLLSSSGIERDLDQLEKYEFSCNEMTI